MLSKFQIIKYYPVDVMMNDSPLAMLKYAGVKDTSVMLYSIMSFGSIASFFGGGLRLPRGVIKPDLSSTHTFTSTRYVLHVASTHSPLAVTSIASMELPRPGRLVFEF